MPKRKVSDPPQTQPQPGLDAGQQPLAKKRRRRKTDPAAGSDKPDSSASGTQAGTPRSVPEHQQLVNAAASSMPPPPAPVLLATDGKLKLKLRVDPGQAHSSPSLGPGTASQPSSFRVEALRGPRYNADAATSAASTASRLPVIHFHVNQPNPAAQAHPAPGRTETSIAASYAAGGSNMESGAAQESAASSAPYGPLKRTWVRTKVLKGARILFLGYNSRMENWGLITYRLNALLFDEKASSLTAKQRVAYVVSHELAHQWFGNLCTMDWWTDLWLNEGFATWVGWLAVDHVFPEWNVWVQFLTDDFRRATELDALRSSHPIEVEIKKSGEIGSIFDAISYCKGASVIRMLFNFLDTKKAIQGLQQYLQAHIYANAATKDLWAALDKSSGIDVSQMMTSWTKQTGYPVVTVEDSVVDGATVLKLTQTRFLASGKPTSAEDANLWWVPLGITTSAGYGKVDQSLFNTRTLTLNLGKLGDGFFKLNHKHNGFFRTIYSPSSLAKLGKAVEAGELKAIEDRVGLLSDMFALSCAGLVPTVQALELVSHYATQQDYVVWNEILDNLASLKSLYYNQGKEVLEGFDLFIRSLVSAKVKTLGWEPVPGEHVLTNMLRSLIIKFAGAAGDPEVVKEAFRRFKAHQAGDASAIHPNIRDEIYSIVIRHGGKEEYESLLGVYRTAPTVDGKLAALMCLGRTPIPELIERTLEFSLSDEVKPQDIIYVFAGIKANAFGRDRLWEFVKRKWAVLHERYYAGLMIMSRVVQHSTSGLNSEAKAKEVEAFFQGGCGSTPVENLRRIIDQSLEQIRTSASWLERDRASVAGFLTSNKEKWAAK